MQLVVSFLGAAIDGDVTTVDQTLRNGMPVDVSNDVGQTALRLATMSNRTDTIKHLLHEGAHVNRQTRFNKYTPLHFAARNNYTGVARLLLTMERTSTSKIKSIKHHLMKQIKEVKLNVCSCKFNKVRYKATNNWKSLF